VSRDIYARKEKAPPALGLHPENGSPVSAFTIDNPGRSLRLHALHLKRASRASSGNPFSAISAPLTRPGVAAPWAVTKDVVHAKQIGRHSGGVAQPIKCASNRTGDRAQWLLT